MLNDNLINVQHSTFNIQHLTFNAHIRRLQVLLNFTDVSPIKKIVEVEIPAENKARRPLLVRVVPQTKDQQQESATGCIVIARDISDLRDVEEEASKQRAFLSSLVDLAPDEIYTLDAEHRFSWMNQRAELDSGLTRSVLLGQDFSMIVTSESREEAGAAVQCTLAGEQKQFEVRTICADGRIRCMDAHTSPLWHDGSITGVMVFMSDITERKLAQERAARSDKLRALGELAAGVAHNLNNSLTVIQGRAQLLLMRSGADEPNKKSLEVITQAVGDCSQTLRRLLDFSRRGSTRVSAPVDLSELVVSSVEIARPKWQAESAHRTGTIEVRMRTPKAVLTLGDSSELREVVLNLIFNAVDAMPHGGAIEIGTRNDGLNACFWVADTGSGMPPEVIARIFEPFYSTKGERGTGPRPLRFTRHHRESWRPHQRYQCAGKRNSFRGNSAASRIVFACRGHTSGANQRNKAGTRSGSRR